MDRVLSQFEEVVSLPAMSSGAAWTAWEPNGNRRVLIKRLPDESAKTRATQALALRHPQIVPTRRWLRDGDCFYVVRDWVSGQNLRQTLSDFSLRAFDRLHTRLLPLLDAIDYAHGAGLSHGAVTPENVLVAEQFPAFALLSDFARESAPTETPRADFIGLCELYKEFLPARAEDDEAGAAARVRLLRNLTETQQTTQSAEELRYKLDAIARMAELLGFNSGEMEADEPRTKLGARLVCAVSPPTATVTPGGGTTVTLALDNDGDTPLHIESVASDVVWLNLPNRFNPVDLAPGTGGDLRWTLSGARLEPGTYQATLSVRSNDGLLTVAPPPGTAWPLQMVAVPVLVKGPSTEEPVPLADSLPHPTPSPPGQPVSGDHPGIACVQEPDPGLVRYGQASVLHIGVRNIGPTRLRVDRLHTRPQWLTYPGDLRAVWIEPGATQYLGFAVDATALTGGDYKAEVTFTTSIITETMVGPKPVWRDMTCEVRVRVVRAAGDALPGGLGKAGCAPLLLALASSLGLVVWGWAAHH
jgi:hypothetical protein